MDYLTFLPTLSDEDKNREFPCSCQGPSVYARSCVYEALKEMFALVSKLGDEPKVKPTENVKTKFSVSDWRKSYKQDLEQIQEQFNKQNDI